MLSLMLFSGPPSLSILPIGTSLHFQDPVLNSPVLENLPWPISIWAAKSSYSSLVRKLHGKLLLCFYKRLLCLLLLVKNAWHCPRRASHGPHSSLVNHWFQYEPSFDSRSQCRCYYLLNSFYSHFAWLQLHCYMLTIVPGTFTFFLKMLSSKNPMRKMSLYHFTR